MIDLVGTIENITKDFKTGKWNITASLENRSIEELAELFGQKVRLKVNKYVNKRSKDANAYAWVLMDKLAYKTGIPKIEVYRRYIPDIGGNSEIVCVKTDMVDKETGEVRHPADELINGWGNGRLGWIAERMPSKIDGCTNVILYYGSSTFDTRQMSKLIDMIIEDCRAVGISTETPEEIARIKEEWK